MQVKIENDQVRKNIELFLDLLNRCLVAQEEKALHQRVYRAFINRINGEIVFPDLLPEPTLLETKEWKVVELRCDPIEKSVVFEVDEAQGDKRSFHCEELAPLAYRNVAETIHTLNECADLFPRSGDLNDQMLNLSQLAIAPSSLVGPYNLLQAIWHPLDRFGAENLLLKQPYGSFIFRKETYSKWLEEALVIHFNRPIKCFTLSYIEPDNKVCDLTLIFDQDCFQIYNDDPSLGGKSYSTLEELLFELKDRCKYPVFY